MTIHEQITALLDGELVDAGAVDELLHVLAVSPEKRALLVEQVAMKRRFTASAAAVVPPAGADLAIMRGLAAVDAGFAGAAAAVGDPTPAPFALAGGSALWRIVMLGALSLLLVTGGVGLGYLMRGDGGTDASAQASGIATDSRTSLDVESVAALGAARDSIAMLTTRLAGMTGHSPSSEAGVSSRPGTSGELAGSAGPLGERSTSGERSSSIVDGARRSAAPRISPRQPLGARELPLSVRQSTANGAEPQDEQTLAAGSRGYLIPAHSRRTPLPATNAAVGRPEAVRAGVTTVTEPYSAIGNDGSSPIGLLVGARNNSRLSLPRVYGLSEPAHVMLDRELFATYELGGQNAGLLSRLRTGAAFGQTQFSMVLHSNTGGAAIDTITEMSPQAYYGRVFIAPEIVRIEDVSGLLEVGGGYSEAGGFGTVGLNLEYRIDRVAVHTGVSSWLLWTRFNGAVELSTNLNFFFGAAIGF